MRSPHTEDWRSGWIVGISEVELAKQRLRKLPLLAIEVIYHCRIRRTLCAWRLLTITCSELLSVISQR